MSKNNSVDNSIIRVGIDLGTTNSEIAICADNEVEIVKCGEGIDYTPSVFGIDKAGNKIVGHRAYRKFDTAKDDDLENIKKEVKRLMGTGEKVKFPRAQKAMLPEEISAEILKSLKEDVIKKYSDINVKSVVITVPAYFDSVQCEATMRAAKMAGFEQVILLEEPIAAAMAYGYKRSIDANWLVFDFGGGTFDVALISSSDGMLKVIDHGGDNYLGGKDIDKAIVEEVIKPKILEKYQIRKFTEAQEARLSRRAEDAKKALSNSGVAAIDIDGFSDDNGEDVDLSIDLTRDRFESIIKPIIDKTIDITKEVISRSAIKSSSVSKIILVGGPTQIPYLRERLAEEMRIDIETSVDPLTIVARGACVYGMGHRVEEGILENNADEKEKSRNAYKASLNYEAMTSSESEVVSGTIEGLPNDGEYYIRINSDSGYYNSTSIPIKKNGSFYDTLAIEPGKANRFWLYLTNEDGESLPIYPDSFTITHGLTVRGVPIPHGIGVIYGKKDMHTGEYVQACDEFFAHGDILPLEKTMQYTTIRALKKNDSNDLPIEVYEGDYIEPRSNKVITTVSIDGSELPHDLPKDTDIELTISISEAREVKVEVYIPDIDCDFDARVQIFGENVSKSDIEESVEQECERIENSNASESEKHEIKKALKEIKEDVEENNNTDNRQKASREIDRIRSRISELSNESKREGLVRRFEEKQKNSKELLDTFRKENPSEAVDFEQEFEEIFKKGNRAIRDRNYGELEYLINEIEEITRRMLQQSPSFWIAMLYKLRATPISEFRDSFEARELLEKGNEAINRNNLEELRSAVIGLINLLPNDEQDMISDINVGITR